MVINGIITGAIGIAECAQTIGCASSDLGTICTSDLVNANSLYKPINANTPRKLTKADYESYNFGYTIVSYNRFSGSGNGKSLVQGLQSGDKWAWQKPTTFYRLTDFDGYNHGAANPFGISIDRPTPTMQQTVHVSFATAVSELLKWAAWKNAGYTESNLYVAALVTDESLNPIGLRYLTGGGVTLGDLEDENKLSNINLDIPPACQLSGTNIAAGRTYRIYAVLTTQAPPAGFDTTNRGWVLPSSGGTWWVMPSDNPPTITPTAVNYYPQALELSGNTCVNTAAYTADAGQQYVGHWRGIVFKLGWLAGGYSGSAPTALTFRFEGHNGVNFIALGQYSTEQYNGGTVTLSLNDLDMVTDMGKDAATLRVKVLADITVNGGFTTVDFGVFEYEN